MCPKCWQHLHCSVLFSTLCSTLTCRPQNSVGECTITTSGPWMAYTVGVVSVDQHYTLRFHLDHELAWGLSTSPVQEFVCVSHPRHVYQDFVMSFPRQRGFVYLGSCSGVSRSVPREPRHISVCPRRDVHLCCFLQSGRYWQIAITVGCGRDWLTWLVRFDRVSIQVSASDVAPCGILPCGGLGFGGSFVGRLFVPSCFTLLNAPFLVGGGVEESTQAFTFITICLATTLAYATPT